MLRALIGFLTITLGMVAAALVPSPPETGFLNRTLSIDGEKFRYQVYVPAEYDDSRKWPVILFLHGSGERGSDGLHQTVVGLGSAIRSHPERFPAIVIFPQAPEGKRWSGQGEAIALKALEQTLAQFEADPDRVYLVGLSMGGRGAIQIAQQEPERFAAMVAVCGWVVPPKAIADIEPPPPESEGDPYGAAADRLKGIPIRLYHGSQDTVVPASESRRLAVALHERSADAKYTEYSDVGHAAWDKAFADAELWKWLFAQRRAP